MEDKKIITAEDVEMKHTQGTDNEESASEAILITDELREIFKDMDDKKIHKSVGQLINALKTFLRVMEILAKENVMTAGRTAELLGLSEEEIRLLAATDMIPTFMNSESALLFWKPDIEVYIEMLKRLQKE